MKKWITMMIVGVLVFTLLFSGCIENNGDDNGNGKELTASIHMSETVYYSWEEIIFEGSGGDIDGQIVLYEWDFDGDGVFDYSSNSTGTVYYIYHTTGEFTAVFRVTDDNGRSASASINISVFGSMPPTPPEIRITHPKSKAEVSGIIDIKGWAGSGDSRTQILAVELRVNDGEWQDAKVEYDNTSYPEINWSHELDTTRLPNGKFTIFARTIDDEYGPGDDFNHSIEIIVDNREPIETYSFEDHMNNTAWYGVATDNEPMTQFEYYMNYTFDNKSYSKVSESDNVFMSTSSADPAMGETGYPYHLFRFKILNKSVSELKITWEGQGTSLSVKSNGSSIYIWDNSSSIWQELGSYTSKPGDQVIKVNIANISNYIVENNFVLILAVCAYRGVGDSDSNIITDYVEVVVYE